MSSIINQWCSKSPGIILWWSDVVFFLGPTFTSTCLAYFYFPHSPKITSTTPGGGPWTCSLQSNVGRMNSIKSVIIQLWGGCALALKTPKWHGAATLSGLFFCYCRWVCFSLMDWTSEQTVSASKKSLRSSKPDWITDEVLSLWMVPNCTEAGRNI